MVIVSIFFILAVLLNNYLAAFLVGTSFAPIFISFLMSLLLYVELSKWRFIGGSVCAIIFEMIGMFEFGTFLFPFMAVALIYSWISLFLELQSNPQSYFLKSLIVDGLALSVLTYIFILVYLIFITGYQLDEVGLSFRRLIDMKAILYTIGSSLLWVVLFKKLKPKAHVQSF